MGEKIVRVGGWECSWSAVWESMHETGQHYGVREEAICRSTSWSYLLWSKTIHRGAHTCSPCVGCHKMVGGICCWPPPSPQKFCRSHGNELSSQIKHELGAGSPLGHTLWFGYLSTTVCLYTHTSTHTGRGRQKSLPQNKGIIIPYIEKWSLHFPARFRSLI